MKKADNVHKNEPRIDNTAEQCLEIGGRISRSPSQLLIDTAFRNELEHQKGLNRAIGLADMAHTLMAIEGGLIPEGDGARLLGVLLDLHCNPEQLKPQPERGDLYTNRESWIASRSPSVKWLGIGRARREATTTAFLITIRAQLLDLHCAILGYTDALVQKADCHQNQVMPDYTYLQSAQPTSFGHFILGYAYALMRDIDRIQGLFRRVNLSPAGCGSSNGSRLPQNRDRLAELLGFAGLVMHARDAMWQADLPIEVASVLCTVLINLDRLAEDLQIFSTQEFGLVELDDSHSRASKILPQKKNPFSLSHIRATANEMIGLSASTMAAGRTPSGQPDNRLTIYGTIPSAIEKTTGAVALMSETLSKLRFNTDTARQKLDLSDALATDLAELLIGHADLDPRSAHRIVGRLVRDLLERKTHLAGLKAEEISRVAKEISGVDLVLDNNALEKALSPLVSVRSKTQTGSCSELAMKHMLEEMREFTPASRQWAIEKQAEISEREKELLAAVSDLAG